MSQDPPNPEPAEPPRADPSPSGAEPSPAIETTRTAPAWGYPQGKSSRTANLTNYLAANRGRFTDEALAARATEAGYTQQEIDGTMQAFRSAEAAAPVRRRARNIVLAAYLVTYAVLVLGMASNNDRYGSGTFGIMVLTVALVVALAIALALVGRARPRAGAEMAMAGVLAIPVILLVVVAGLCVATGLPIPRTAYDAGPGFGPGYTPISSELPPAPAKP